MGLLNWLFGPNIVELVLDAKYDRIKQLASKDKKVVDRLIELVRRGWQRSYVTLSDGSITSLSPSMGESRAYVALGEIGDERAVEPLLEILNRGYADRRSMAAEALGKIGNKQAVDSLIEALEDSDSGACLSAIVALGKIGDQKAVGPLIKRVGHDKLGFYFAPEALVEIGKPAVGPLIEALKDGPPIVCWRAAWALAEIGDRKAVEPLIQLPEELESRESLRSRDFGAPETLGLYEALGKLGDESAIQYLIRALKEGYRDGRYYAAKALGEIGDVKALPELERVAKEDEYAPAAEAAKEAIDKIREQLK